MLAHFSMSFRVTVDRALSDRIASADINIEIGLSLANLNKHKQLISACQLLMMILQHQTLSTQIVLASISTNAFVY